MAVGDRLPGVRKRAASHTAVAVLTAALAACGGSDRARESEAVDGDPTEQSVLSPGGPMAADGLRWINQRREQAGLGALRRDPALDQAASRHAAYQQQHNVISHTEDPAKPGYTGETPQQRLRAAGFPLLVASFADGEVISATSQPDGIAAAEGLLGAIYHRYLILEPLFNAVGVGVARRDGGYHWLNVNLVGLKGSTGLGPGLVAVWPAPQQQRVRTNFYSDQETPDPVPDRDEVGYPVSVHANMNTVLRVDYFSLSGPDGRSVAALQLDAIVDRDTPSSAAALVPLQPLRAGSMYRVEFIGAVDEQSVKRSWTFTTR